jgi:glycosyltransferase involved in cell wall biosynthesis
MQRRISPIRDCIGIWRLTWILLKIKPDIVQTHTPKAGLLGMIASVASGVPVRIFTVNGLVWETVGGWRGTLLHYSDRIAAALATRVLCVSNSVRELMLAKRSCRPEKAAVLGSGGSHGVDLHHFDPKRFSPEQRRQFREQNRLPAGGFVLGFVGRFVPDKGIETLLKAWRALRTRLPGAALLLVGERESSHPIAESLWAEIANDPRISVTRGFPGQMPEIYSTIDVLVLPTLREGLPGVLLEAGAMEIPVVATRATGCIDAVLDGETGVLVRVDSADELAAAILNLAGREDFRGTLGVRARKHIAANFSEQTVSVRLADAYWQLLSEREDVSKPSAALSK